MTEIEVFESPFPYFRVFNLYTDDELKLIWKELDFILNSDNLLGPNQTGSAYRDNKLLKKNLGFFLDDFYKNRDTSNILKLNRKVFSIIKEVSIDSNNWFLRNFTSNFDATLLSYYEDQDVYGKHQDNSLATCLTWFYKEPRVFRGGNLVFEDYNIEIEIKQNSMLFFPSIIPHGVSKVSLDHSYCGEYRGRICISQFIGLYPQA